MTTASAPRWQSALLLAVLLCLSGIAAAGERPLFDAHLHYNPAHAGEMPPEAATRALDRAGIVRAVVAGRDPDTVEALMRTAPGRITPFLDVYSTAASKNTWMHDPDLPSRVRARLDAGLATGPWRGIGELHLFADNRHSPVFEALVRIARDRNLPLMIHGDPAVIDRAFEIEPEAVILWAHAGTFPYPPLVRDYLDRYPHLRVDLSMRSGRLNPDGRGIPEDWRDLLIEHADRFLIGADTFSTARWRELELHAAEIRAWLEHLPKDVAHQIAFGNAARLFP